MRRVARVGRWLGDAVQLVVGSPTCWLAALGITVVWVRVILPNT